MRWQNFQLRDVSDSIDYGVSESAVELPVGPKFLRITDIQDDAVNWDTVPFCSGNERKLKSAQLRPGDIVFARTGATTGKSFLVRDCPTDAVFASYLIRVRAKSLISPSYLAQFFRSSEYWKQISAKAVGAAQPGINASKLGELIIPVPPLAEQKRIAAILDQADELRRKRQRAIDRLNQLGQAIFYEMFGNFDGGSTPVARLGALTSKIGSGATPKGGDSAYKPEGTPLIRSMNVRDGEFSEKGLVFLDDQQAAKLNNVIVQANDVLLNITGASVARVCLAPPHMESARVNQHVSIIRLSQSITSEFLEAFLLMPRTKRKLLTIAEAGATRQAITKAQIEELEVPVPELSRQREFIERLRLARQSTVAMISQSTALEAMFASLQHRAFQGEL